MLLVAAATAMAKRKPLRGDPPAITAPHVATALPQAFPWVRAILGLVALLAGLRMLRGPTAPPQTVVPGASDRARDAGASDLAPLVAADLVTEVRTLTPPNPQQFQNACRSSMDFRRWTLSGMNSDAARAFVTASFDNAAQRSAVLDTLQCTSEACTVLPSVEALESLSTAARTRVFRELVRTRANFTANNAFRRSVADGPYSRIPGMPESAKPWLDRVEFTVDGRRIFCDASVVCAHVTDEREQVAMFAALQSASSITASLRANLDPERVAQAFRPSARDEVRARFAAARRDGETTIPLREFLPPAMRERVDRYPEAVDAAYNCFWTALRFDVSQPAWPLDVPGAMRAALPQTHRQVRDGSVYFGDLLLFADRNGLAIHAVNYLVGGLVLTKDGPGGLRPWRVAWLDEITLAYPNIAEVTVWRPDR